jgi:hypothetical protein
MVRPLINSSMLGSLLHQVSERFSILDHARVPRHYGDERGRFPEEFCRCKMNSITYTNGFHGERPAGACEHVIGNCDDVTAAPEGLQPPLCRPLAGRGQATGKTGAY